MILISIWISIVVRLSQLAKNASALVLSVDVEGESDPIAVRLTELGFVAGEEVRLITTAPFGGDPILVQVGFTRFALRLSEANRVLVEEIKV